MRAKGVKIINVESFGERNRLRGKRENKGGNLVSNPFLLA